jgi:predicted NUDIX family phosphoesterase
MDKMDVKIMVTPTNYLLWDKPFQGFMNNSQKDFHEMIYANHDFLRRWDMEENPSYKQTIAYWIFVHRESKSILAYKRGKKWWEVRLHDDRSIWIGGHIDFVEWERATIEKHLEREIEEEIWLKNTKHKLIWYINDDSNEVWKVHFWVVYLVEAENMDIIEEEWTITKWEFISIEQLQKLHADWLLENRSSMCVNPIIELL